MSGFQDYNETSEAHPPSVHEWMNDPSLFIYVFSWLVANGSTLTNPFTVSLNPAIVKTQILISVAVCTK